jgi:hypothetical protein
VNLVDVDEELNKVHSYTFSPNYPNPFNPTTTIVFSVPERGRAKIVVYDLAGREVDVLVDRVFTSGEYQAMWDGKNRIGEQVVSGVYFARITVNDYTAVTKMVLLR